MAHFVAHGYAPTEPPILQPASVFLDMAGEEIRGKLILASDSSGAELCLRPEYTAPVCRAYLAEGAEGRQAHYTYAGPVFRAGSGKPGRSGQTEQAGLESYGRRDAEAADAEIFALAMEAGAEVAGTGLQARIGDVAIFDRVLAAMEFPQTLLRRLRRALARGQDLDAALAAAAPTDGRSGVLAALEKSDHAGAKALVEDLLAIAGIAAVGGRSVSEIADRFLDNAALRAGTEIDDGKKQVLKGFLAVSGSPDAAAAELRSLARDAHLDLTQALDAFERRNGFIAARGQDVDAIVYSFGFAPDLDYYTGFVFDASPKGLPRTRPGAAGGRYDGLARKLGAKGDVPAVGAALLIDRLRPSGDRS